MNAPQRLSVYGAGLVALRDGDLAYLHVYLDVKVGGVVRTAHFVLDATGRE